MSRTATTSKHSCPSPLCRFWVIDLFGVGNVARDWSSSASYVWSTSSGASPGTYAVSVEARDKSDPKVEATNTVLNTLGCTYLVVSPSPTSPQLPATSVVFTAISSSCPSPVYQFWVVDPHGVGVLEQSWSTAASSTWTTTSRVPPGTYTIQVELRNSNEVEIELEAIVSYTLGSPPPTKP